MRYDTPIKFYRTEETTFDRLTGDYRAKEVLVDSRLALVMPTSKEDQGLMYGNLQAGAITILLKFPVYEDYSIIEIDSERYTPSMVTTYRNKQTIRAIKGVGS